VVCFKGATFSAPHPGDNRKLFERSLVGLRQAGTVFIAGSQAVLPNTPSATPEVGNRPDRCRVLYEFGPGDLGRDMLTRVIYRECK
jgi:hypothetical protein